MYSGPDVGSGRIGAFPFLSVFSREIGSDGAEDVVDAELVPDAYNRLARRADATPRRLDRLLDAAYADGCLWSELIGVLRITPDRLRMG